MAAKITSLFGIEPLTGAYGRRYNSIVAMQKDFDDGMEFRAVSGQYASKRDFENGTLIQCRYGKGGTKTHMLKVKNDS